jgi:ribosome-associated toxin RatA of RatAB toxin-antitoxin module
MPTVRKSVIVPRSCAEMFALVDDIEHYPDFLPWCSGTEVLERTAQITRARLDIDFHGITSHFTTLNRKHPPESMELEFVEGPFETFKGMWRFKPLGDKGCRVEFALDYKFSSTALELLLGPAFGHIVETMVDRFVERSEASRTPERPRRAKK